MDKAEQLLIIGNGFDKNCKLNSSFSDYMQYTFTKKTLSNALNDFFNQKQVYLFQEFDYILESFSDDLFNQFNIWDFIFMINFYSKSTDDSLWSDIETTIHEYTKSSTDKNNKYTESKIFTYFKRTKNLESFKPFNTMSKGQEDELISWFFYKIYKSSKEMRGIETEEGLLVYLLKKLKEYEKRFKDYLLNNAMNNEYVNKAHSLYEKMVNSLVTNILSFNYTQIDKTTKSTLHHIKNFENIHGTLSRSNNIIGIDSTKVNVSNLNYMFTKTYRKVAQFTEYDDKEQNTNEYFEKSIKTIKFYGHSLNSNDYAYFQTIFDYFDLYNNSTIKLIFMYSIYDSDKSDQIKINVIKGVTGLIENYGSTLDNSFKGKNLLHRLLNQKRLVIKEI